MRFNVEGRIRNAMRHTLSVGQVRGRLIHDQVIRVDGLRHRAVAQWARVDLLETVAAKPRHE
jgi:hypothetical protein